MSSSKKTPSKNILSTPKSSTVSPLKMENDIERKDATPTKKVKLNEIIQIGVVGSVEYGDCAIEIKNGYAM